MSLTTCLLPPWPPAEQATRRRCDLRVNEYTACASYRCSGTTAASGTPWAMSAAVASQSARGTNFSKSAGQETKGAAKTRAGCRGQVVGFTIMPGRSYIIFGDIEGKLDVLRVECTKCARKGRYSVRRLIEKYGRRANLMKWNEQLNGDCPGAMDTACTNAAI